MKRLFLLCVIFSLLFSITVSSQVQPQSDVAIFEQFVVKEHFVTKKEIKNYIDQKTLEYQKTTEAQLSSSFKEIENIINSKINKFIVKLLAGIFGVVVFSGSFWYFLKVRLDVRHEKIKEVKKKSTSKAPNDKKPESKKIVKVDSLKKMKDELVAEKK